MSHIRRAGLTASHFDEILEEATPLQVRIPENTRRESQHRTYSPVLIGGQHVLGSARRIPTKQSFVVGALPGEKRVRCRNAVSCGAADRNRVARRDCGGTAA